MVETTSFNSDLSSSKLLAGDEKKPGLPPPLPSWNTVRWMTYDDGEHQLEFFLAEAPTVLLRPTASSLRWRYF